MIALLLPRHQTIHATINPDIVDKAPPGNTPRPECPQLMQSPTLKARWPLEVHVAKGPTTLFHDLQDIMQESSTLLSFVSQSCPLAWPHIEILYGRPCGTWSRHPYPPGQSPLHALENFRAHSDSMKPQPVSNVNILALTLSIFA